MASCLEVMEALTSGNIDAFVASATGNVEVDLAGGGHRRMNRAQLRALIAQSGSPWGFLSEGQRVDANEPITLYQDPDTGSLYLSANARARLPTIEFDMSGDSLPLVGVAR